MIAQVGAPVEMRLALSFDSRDAERTRHVRRRRTPRLLRAMAGAVRGTSRAWECRSRFSFCENRRSKFAAHQVPQDHLLPGALDFQAGREASSRIPRSDDPETAAALRPHAPCWCGPLWSGCCPEENISDRTRDRPASGRPRRPVPSRTESSAGGSVWLKQRALFLVVERSSSNTHGLAPRASGSLPGTVSACIRIRSYRSTPASAARRPEAPGARPAAIGGHVRASRLARCIRYPPNNSSAPSPLSATVALAFVSRERNHTGSAPESAFGSSQ